MNARTIMVMVLAGVVLMGGVMMAGCEKKTTPPPKAAEPNTMAAMAADAKAAVKTAADETVKVAGEAATAAKETAKAAAESAKTAADNTKTAVVAAVASAEQTMCPVLTKQPIDKSIFVEYKGKKVYFCCTDCKAAFEKEPEKYVASLPQFK